MLLWSWPIRRYYKADKHGGDWSYASALSLLQRAKLGNDDLDRYVTLDVTRIRTANKGNTNSNGRGNDSSSSRGRRQQRGGGRGKGGDSNSNTNNKSSSNDTNGGK